jgi:hypothetical protein
MHYTQTEKQFLTTSTKTTTMKINYITIYKIKNPKELGTEPVVMSALSCHSIYMFADKGCEDLYYEINMPEILSNAKTFAQKVYDCKFYDDDNNDYDTVVVAEERPFQYQSIDSSVHPFLKHAK